MADWPVDPGYDLQRPGGQHPHVDRSARSSASRNSRSPRRTARLRPAPETTSFDEPDVSPEPDVPPRPGVPHPMPSLCGPEDPAASQIAEANEPRGAMTAAGHIGPSTIHRQPTAA